MHVSVVILSAYLFLYVGTWGADSGHAECPTIVFPDGFGNLIVGREHMQSASYVVRLAT